MSKVNWKIGGLSLFMLVMAILVIFLGRVATEQQKYTLYDPNSYDPNGFKALHLLLTKYKYHPVKLDTFRNHSAPALVVYTAARIPAAQKKSIVNWVRSGGILIELAQSSPNFSTDSRFFPATANQKITARDPRFSGLTYTIKNQQVYGINPPVKGFFRLGKTGIIARQPLKKGILLSWTDPRGLTNRSLKAAPDNGVIFILWLKTAYPSGNIDFLDLRYSKSRATDPGELFEELFSRYGVVLFLLLIGIGLALWKAAARFGRPRPLTVIRGRSYDEFVIFLARLFQRANAKSFVLENLWRALIYEIADLTGFPPTTPVTLLLDRLQTVTRRDYPQLLEINRLLQQPSLHLSTAKFLSVAAAIDTCRKELLKWKKSTNSLI
jgi:hypothetical protein